MRKRAVLALYTTSRKLLYETALFLLAFVFAASCLQLVMTAEYLNHTYRTVQHCLPKNALYLLPADRLENRVTEDYLLNGTSKLDSDVTAELDESFGGDAEYGRAFFASGSDSENTFQVVGYNLAMTSRLNYRMNSGSWLHDMPMRDGRIPLVIRGSLERAYSPGDCVDFTMTDIYGNDICAVKGYVAGVLASNEIVFLPTTGSSEPNVDSVVARDAYNGWNSESIYDDSGMVILSADMLAQRRLPLSSCRYIFPGGDAQFTDTHFNFGCAWTSDTLINNSVNDFLAVNRSNIATAIALVLCSVIALTGYNTLWYYRNARLINLYIMLGVCQRRIAAICRGISAAIMILGLCVALALAPRIRDALFYGVELTGPAYAYTALAMAVPILFSEFLYRLCGGRRVRTAGMRR